MDLKELAIWVNRELAERSSQQSLVNREAQGSRNQSRSSCSKFSSKKTKIFHKEDLVDFQGVKNNTKNVYEPHTMSQGDGGDEVLSD